MAELGLKIKRSRVQSQPGTNEMVFLNITSNDVYIVMINNREPNIDIVFKTMNPTTMNPTTRSLWEQEPN